MESWTAKDPIRFDGGVNLYAYAENDPVNVIDPDGRRPRTIVETVMDAVHDWFGSDADDDDRSGGTPYREPGKRDPDALAGCAGLKSVWAKDACCLRVCGVPIKPGVCATVPEDKQDCYDRCMHQ
jgi:hypothetical protein